MTNPHAIVVALEREARCLEGICDPKWIAVLGPGAPNVENTLERFIQQGASGIVSFGFAGGLPHPRFLREGNFPELITELIIPRCVSYKEGEKWHALECTFPLAWEYLAPYCSEPLVGVEALVTTPQEKASLFAQTQGCAVDMESHHLGKCATRLGLPFFVVRAIVDGPQMALPSSVLTTITPEGKLKIFSLLWEILRGNCSLSSLMLLKRCSENAQQILHCFLELTQDQDWCPRL